jgi:hypothetical protein
MWLIIGLSIALANPDRPLERLEDRLKQRHYAQLNGDGPVYGNKYGPIEAWVFPDGIIQRYIKPLTNDKTETRRFSAAGLPLSRVLKDANGPLSVKIYGPNDFVFDVEEWSIHSVHGLIVHAPENPTTGEDGTYEWKLSAGTFRVGATAPIDPFTPEFSQQFESNCRCVIDDRDTTWLNSEKAIRTRIQQLHPDKTKYGDLWVFNHNQRLITIQWISNSGAHFDKGVAQGKAMIALIEEDPNL